MRKRAGDYVLRQLFSLFSGRALSSIRPSCTCSTVIRALRLWGNTSVRRQSATTASISVPRYHPPRSHLRWQADRIEQRFFTRCHGPRQRVEHTYLDAQLSARIMMPEQGTGDQQDDQRNKRRARFLARIHCSFSWIQVITRAPWRLCFYHRHNSCVMKQVRKISHEKFAHEGHCRWRSMGPVSR